MATPEAHAHAHGPVPTPLPPVPSGDFMSEAQWETFFALLDGALPSIASASTIRDQHGQISVPDDELDRIVDQTTGALDGTLSKDAMVEFLGYRHVEDPRFREDCLRTLATVPHRMRLAKVLGLLGTYAGSMLLTGYLQPISQQPTRVREAILKSWTTSRLPSLRLLAKTVGIMAQKANGMTSPYFEKLSGYTEVPKDWKAGQGYDFKFVQVAAGNDGHEITTDVVIVGSGCGGGVCAKNLAEAGHRVLVVDKGYYYPPTRLPMTQESGTKHLFDRGGAYMSEDSSISVGCGGTWGGGGTVNWSVCFRLQDFVRREWAEDAGLGFFASAGFDECMDRVWDFIGAGTGGIRHNHRNRMLLEGAGKLGWQAGEASQNTAGREHYCGRCHLGCGSAEKKGPAVAWLPAAAEAGAEFMEGFRVESVLFAADGVTATGVEGVWTARDEEGGVHEEAGERTQRRVVIRAKKVIVSAGSLWSPVVLMKSGIENAHLGYNLHLHPVNYVTAVHREETRPWEGGIITSYSAEFENLDGKGHGVKLEPVCMLPFMALVSQSWSSGLDARLISAKYGHLSGFISLVRDRDSGRVYPDPETGEPRIEYTPSDFDRDHVLEGVQALAKICYVSGAAEIRTGIPGLPPFIRPTSTAEAAAELAPGEDPEFADAAFGAWLQRLRGIGNGTPVTGFGSAHQMGSCRMSAREDAGVVDEKGRVWGRRNLYVADASVFPSASGVNPMVTAMAVADWISRGVARELSG